MEEATNRRTMLTALAVVAVVTVVAVAAAIGWFRGSSADSLQTDGCPSYEASAFERHGFDSVAKMAVTADLVVRAQVKGIEPGRTYGNPDEAHFRVREVTLTIDEVLTSKVGAPDEVILEEEGWDEKDRCYIFNGLTWSDVGETYYYFLRQNPDKETYIHVSSQGRALLTSDQGLQAPEADTDLERVVEQLTPTQLEDEVRQAAIDLREGRIEPQPARGDKESAA